ncbi:hypothetical protein K0M31_018325, partial [Melipona bicolor]
MQCDPDNDEEKRRRSWFAPKEFVIPRSVAALTVIRRRQSVPRLTSDYAPRAGLDDDGDDDEFMTMIISGGVPLRCHRCLSFRRGDSGVKKRKEKKKQKKRPENDGTGSVRCCFRIVLAIVIDTRRTVAGKLVVTDWHRAGISKVALNQTHS